MLEKNPTKNYLYSLIYELQNFVKVVEPGVIHAVSEKRENSKCHIIEIQLLENRDTVIVRVK